MKNWLRQAEGSWLIGYAELKVHGKSVFQKKVIRVQAISSPPPFVFQHEMTRAVRTKYFALKG